MFTDIGWFARRAGCLAALVLAACATAALAEPASGPGTTYKILHIMSYRSPWRWTDGQLQGFKEGVAGVRAEYRTFEMDTKHYSAPEAKERRAGQARSLIAVDAGVTVDAAEDEGRGTVDVVPGDIVLGVVVAGVDEIGLPVISLARADKLGLRPTTGLLLAAEVIRKFEWTGK